MATVSSVNTIPEQLLKNWSSKWRDEGLNLFQKAFKTPAGQKQGVTAIDGSDEFQQLLYDLVRCVVMGDLEVDDALSFFTELTSSLGIGEMFPSLLADIFTVLDTEVMCNENKGHVSSFKSLLLACQKMLGVPLMRERLDMDTLELVRLVPSKVNFNQKYVKTKTKLFYKQQKFNLFREENEGYSKLISELGHERRPGTAATAMLDNIRSLIGRFSLDPNRVLDIILETFECHLDERDFFLPLLESYPCQPATFVNILGFKFHQYQHSELSSTPPTPPSLYKLAAVLLHEGLVQLGDLYPHLSLSDATLKQFYDSVFEDATTKARQATVVSLLDKSDEEREKEAQAEKEKQKRKGQVLSIDINQKLGLCHALLELGDWGGATNLMKLLPPLLPVWSLPVTKSICSLVHLSIEPIYRSCSPRAAKGGSLPSSSSASALLKPCSKPEELHPDVFDMLFCLGPQIYLDAPLLAKMLRVGRAFLKGRAANKHNGELPSEEKEEVYHGFLTMLDEVVFPALSLMPCNCGMAEETWAMVKQLPYETRYQLYGHWKNDTYDKHPELINAKTETLSRGRYMMKRLTKDNIKPSGRQIGKLSHSNPGIIFDYVLSQIQRYDNFIIPVVDSLKYLVPLAYDVLALDCIVEALGNPQKERLKHQDTNISDWLQGLASFCGNVFKKYPIDLNGLLQYVANQLKAGKSFDLLVLKEVTQKMSGIDIAEEVTASQLEALAGGELLKAECAYYSQVRNTKKSSQRLRESLVDAHLSLPLFILMAQQRDCIIYRDGASRHLKLVGNLFDNCLSTLVQFGGFLATHLSPDEYSSKMPTLDKLGLEYNVPSDVAFFMLRPVIHNAISSAFTEQERASRTDADKQDKSSKTSRQEASYLAACQQVVDPLVEAARPLYPSKVWDDINCRLFTAFWSLSLYDLYVPTRRYDDEISRAKQAIKDLDTDQEMTSSKKKKEQERNSGLIEKLQEEKQRQEDNHRLVTSWFKKEKDSWFSPKVTKNRTITQFLQLCVFPRCRFTVTDALYCAKFVGMLHSLHTPNFSTLLFYDRIFSDISYTVACCTENEARRYGRFLGALLETVSRWHSSESSYSHECARTPGFISMMRSFTAGSEKQYLDYENYRHITFKWHFKLTKSLVILLESKDYMQVRNGLIVLTKLLPHYPKVYHLSIALEKRIEKIMEEEKEKRQDLYALAIGYAGMLKTHKQNLIPENEFHIREERVKAQQSDAKEKEKEKDSGRSERQSSSATAASSSSSKAEAGRSERERPSATANSSAGKSEKQSSTTSSLPKKDEGKSTSGGAASSSSSSSTAAATTSRSKAEDGGSKTSSASKGSSGSGKESSSKEGSASTKEKEKEKEKGDISTVSSTKSSRESSRERGASKESKESVSGGGASLGSPAVHNGPMGGASPRAGQRRQQAESPDPAAERDAKRRKVDDSASKSSKVDGKAGATASANAAAGSTASSVAATGDKVNTPADKKEKPRSERKRERSSEENVNTKRRKEAPEESTKEAEVKEKKRVVKVGKKEVAKASSKASPKASPKPSLKPSADDEKSKKHHNSAPAAKTRAVKK